MHTGKTPAFNGSGVLLQGVFYESRLLPAGPPAPPAIRWLGMVVDYTLVTMGAVMVVLVFFNVVMHLFHQDIAWTTELCEFMMVWVTFLGGASAARRGAHMTITEFIDKLTGKSRLRRMRPFRSSAWRCFCCWSGTGWASSWPTGATF